MFPSELGSLLTWNLVCMPLPARPGLVSFADLVFDGLPFLPLQLKQRTPCALLLPFLYASCLSVWNAVVPIPPSPPPSSRPICNMISFQNHSRSLPPLNSCDPLFVGCFSKYFGFCMIFLWVYDSCPKWTLCSLVLFISCFILWPSQKDKQCGCALDSLKLLLKIFMGGAFHLYLYPTPSTWNHSFEWICIFFIYVN